MTFNSLCWVQELMMEWDIAIDEVTPFQFPLLGSWKTRAICGDSESFLSIPFVGFVKLLDKP